MAKKLNAAPTLRISPSAKYSPHRAGVEGEPSEHVVRGTETGDASALCDVEMQALLNNNTLQFGFLNLRLEGLEEII